MMNRVLSYTTLFIVVTILIISTPFSLVYAKSPWERWRPLIAGIRINGIGGGCPPNICDRWYMEGSYYASIGFKARYSGKIGFVTAGHFAVAISGIVYQPSAGYPGGSKVGEVKFIKLDDCYDVAFVEITEPDVNIHSKVYSEISITNYDYITDIKYMSQLKEDNGSVIKVGYRTEVTAGKIIRFGSLPDCPFETIVIANYKSDMGDSGGFVGSVKKVYRPDYPKDMYVYGIHLGRLWEGSAERIFLALDYIQIHNIYVDFSNW